MEYILIVAERLTDVLIKLFEFLITVQILRNTLRFFRLFLLSLLCGPKIPYVFSVIPPHSIIPLKQLNSR